MATETPRTATLTWTRLGDERWSYAGQPGDYRVRVHRYQGGGINRNIGGIYGHTVHQYVSVQPIEIGKAKNLATAKAIAECHAEQMNER